MTCGNLVGLVYIVHYCKDGDCRIKVISQGSGKSDSKEKAEKWKKRWGTDFTEIRVGEVCE